MRRKLTTVVVFALCASPAFAWNNLGHKVVAEIAWRQLDPPVRQQIVDTLRRHPRFDTDFAATMEDDAVKGDKAMQDHWIFQHAATWPDQIRKNKTYDHPTWHYINLPIYPNAVDKSEMPRKLQVNLAQKYSRFFRPDEMNLLQAIDYSRMVIASKAAPEDKAVAYCWVLHLVGDIHQPLHSSALFSTSGFPEGDKGGNEILLTHGSNLHSLWDGLLGTRYYTQNVDKVVKELSNRDRFADAWDSASADVSPATWANEGHDLCTTAVYTATILDAVNGLQPGEKLPRINLPRGYYTAAGDLARRRVITAGLRLAALLKAAVQPSA